MGRFVLARTRLTCDQRNFQVKQGTFLVRGILREVELFFPLDSSVCIKHPMPDSILIGIEVTDPGPQMEESGAELRENSGISASPMLLHKVHLITCYM